MSKNLHAEKQAVLLHPLRGGQGGNANAAGKPEGPYPGTETAAFAAAPAPKQPPANSRRRCYYFQQSERRNPGTHRFSRAGERRRHAFELYGCSSAAIRHGSTGAHSVSRNPIVVSLLSYINCLHFTRVNCMPCFRADARGRFREASLRTCQGIAPDIWKKPSSLGPGPFCTCRQEKSCCIFAVLCYNVLRLH